MILSLSLGLSLGLGGNEAEAKGSRQFIAIDGAGNVGGQPALVHILAVVPVGGNAADVAQGALAAQGARPFTSADFSLTGLDWNDSPGADPDFVTVTQNYNPSGDPTPGSVGAAVLDASQVTWTAVAGSDLRIEKGDFNLLREPSLVRESRGRQFFDGENDAAWMDLKDPNTLGVTWSGTSGGVPEADVAMNTDFDWFTNGSDIDAETVFLHELGHVIGIGHSVVDGAVMEAVYDGERRGLHDDDKDAVLALYGAPNDAPVVTISSPVDGATITSGTTVDFSATASDTEDGDLTASLVWTSDIDGEIGSGGSFSTALSDATHTITASVVDNGLAADSDSISITVGDVDLSPGAVTVGSITYAWSGGRDRNKHLEATVTMLDVETNAPVEGVTVFATLDRVSGGVGSWDFAGATGADGTVVFKLIGAGNTDSCYNLTVTSITGVPWDDGQPAEPNACRPNP